MPRIDVIIGAGYGDEGKGLTTSYWSTQFPELKKKLVIRFNGGAQAGHTVEVKGKTRNFRHVFSHIGSGSYHEADTYLPEQFIINPLLFKKEVAEIDFLGDVDIYVHPLARVTTPIDMIINQAIEMHRGYTTTKHGSVGVGINETIKRSEVLKYNLNAILIRCEPVEELMKKLQMIRDEWIPIRCGQLGFKLQPQFAELLTDKLLYNFILDCKYFKNQTKIGSSDILYDFDHLIFEGAQGLMLDMDYGKFPYVTHSNTGMKNVNAILNEACISDVRNIWYVTRCYATRHCAGPMANEMDMKPFKGIVDKTNIPNDWQGTLRYSYLDLSSMFDIIAGDEPKGNAKVGYFVTCLDQIAEDDDVYVFDHGDLKNLGPAVQGMTKLLDSFSYHVFDSNIYYSIGPTADDVVLYK